MWPIVLASFGAVFVAEIAGDKLLYTTGVLATRYRATPIVLGLTAAFMAKMGVAVAVGQAISTLPRTLVAALTTMSFLGIAYTLWHKPVVVGPEDAPYAAPKAAMVSFAAVFLSEWGDVGQVTAATIAAKFSSPLLVWIGAVAAMVAKGALAAWLGAGVRGWLQTHLSPRMIRVFGVGLLLLLGSLAVIETFTRRAG